MVSKLSATRTRRRGQGGNAIVEFAIMAVVMLMLTCGVADFARLFTIANMAVGAAEAGVQYGSLSPSHYSDTAGMRTAALSGTGDYAGADATATQFWTCSVGGTQFTTQPTCNTGSLETYVQVVVTIPYTSIVKYPFIPDPVSISQIAVARVQ